MIRFLLSAYGLMLVAHGVMGQKGTTFYDVFVDRKLIGQMEAIKEVRNDTTKLCIRSNIKTRVLTFDVEINSVLETTSKGKVLLMGKNNQQSNQEEANISSEVRKNGNDAYWVTKNGRSRTIQVSQILGTLTDMYFGEPNNAYLVYSVADADFLRLTPKGNGEFELQLPNGRRNLFTYSKGLLVEMEAPIGFGSVVIRRK
ncbi:MAG: hypothetical protein K2Q22_10395 [Cytophagales bacterium]|nr:hypothetical protein [Cytophagales bacterium]